MEGLGKAPGIAAQQPVGFIAGTIQADIDPYRRAIAQPGNGSLIDHSSVGIDGDQKSHLMQPLHNLAKLGMQKGFTARQQQIEHTGILGFPGQLQPTPGVSQGGNFLLGLTGKADIAHFAIHIAYRGQLKGSTEGNSRSSGLPVQIFCYGRRYGKVIHRQSPFFTSAAALSSGRHCSR